MINPYQYPEGKADFKLSLDKETARWRRYAVSFASAHHNLYPEQANALGRYYQPLGEEPAPLVILIHGLGDNSIIPLKLIARALAGRGIASFTLQMVFHSSRQPPEMRRRYPNLTPEEWFEGYYTSVIEVRQIIDWAFGRPEIDNRKISLAGISLGGIISAIAMGVDRRVKAGIFIVAGGNAVKIDQFSHHAAMRYYQRPGEAEYQARLHRYHHYCEEIALKGLENVAPDHPSYLTDPLTFAPSLKGRHILMLNARRDEVIPREAALDLWEASGRPEIYWFWANHTGIWFWYPFILHKIVRFLGSTFENG